jgi:hypothetical protein
MRTGVSPGIRRNFPGIIRRIPEELIDFPDKYRNFSGPFRRIPKQLK